MVNYPNKKECFHTTYTTLTGKHYTAHRGMNLEDDLNQTNQYYLSHDIAVIHKKPTPIQIVKVDYPQRTAAKIVEAYFRTPSTTDYNGIYKGHYIDFEAKETKNIKGFPISNIHPHQIKHLRNILSQNGICFLIIRFTNLEETYLLKAIDFLNYIDNIKKSYVSIEYIKEKGYLIKEKLLKRIDYLEIIDNMEVLWKKIYKRKKI